MNFETEPIRTEHVEPGDPGPGTGWKAVVAGLVVVVLLLGAGVFLLSQRLDSISQQSVAMEQDLEDARTRVTELEDQSAGARKKVKAITKSVKKLDADFEEVTDKIIDAGAVGEQVQQSVLTVYCQGDLGVSQGTGFAIEYDSPPSGFPTAIVTNYHVIEDCALDSDLPVSTRKGDSRPATQLSSWDEENDLALLFVDKAMPPLKIGRTPRTGDPVVAVGSPYDMENTVTDGIITGIQDDFFTTNAAVGPGNSGGPLVDREGEVLGVTTRKYHLSEGTNVAVRMSVSCRKLVDCT